MKMKKRFLSILLSLVMVLGLMPGMSLTAYAATVSVSKGNGAVAVAPEVTAWTSDSVFAEAVNGQEYVIVNKGETPDWSKAVTPDEGSVTFTGLTPATEYSIYTRVKETDSTLASEPVKVDVMTSLNGWETRGEPNTGETITIIPDPENAEGLTWQWYYAEENEEHNVVRSEAIEGEVSSSYTIKETDIGKYLYYVILKGGKEMGDGYVGPVRIAINPSVTLDGWTYGEAPNTPIVTGNTGNGEESFTYVKKGSEEPESETVPTLPGTYTVFAYVEESGDYAFGYAEADFTIAKGTPAVTAPKARNLVYTGASQELVEAGVAVGGEMQYALGTETVATQPYTTSIPAKTDVGTYYVWYKAVGDENHSDTKAESVKVTIVSPYSNEWVDGKWYNKDGSQTYKPLGSWKKDGSNWKYVDTSGWYAKNRWQKIDGKWYFFDKEGYMEANAYRQGYYLKANGAWDGKAKVAGWKQDSKGWWYSLGGSDFLKNGWKMIDGNWYYFKATGYIAINEFVQGWWLNKTGACKDPVRYSWHKSGSKWWYGTKDGWYAKSKSYTIDGEKYTFDKKGYTK